MTTTEIERAVAAEPTWPTLDELDAYAAAIPRRSYASVKYAGVSQPAGEYVNHDHPDARALAWIATVIHGQRNTTVAARYGFHHGRSVRQARYAQDVAANGVNTLIVRRPERRKATV